MATKPGFFKKNKLAIVWTMAYFAALYGLLYFMFGFNMLAIGNWARLPHLILRGLPGLSFGIVLLAALPIYAATLYSTIRNKKTPIPLPFCKPEKSTEKATAKPAAELPPEPEVRVPAGLPREMREPYMRVARGQALDVYSVYSLPDMVEEAKTIESPTAPTAEASASAYELPSFAKAAGGKPTAGFDTPTAAGGSTAGLPAVAPVTRSLGEVPSAEAGAFPIPTDFDAEPTNGPAAPVFKELTFGNKANDGAKKDSAARTALKTALSARGFKIKSDGGDVIVASKSGGERIAIAIHDDPEFWIADPSPDGAPASDWFASGKQKPSPVVAAIAAAQSENAAPVLYLAASNIMNLETLLPTWESAGVRIITEPAEL